MAIEAIDISFKYGKRTILKKCSFKLEEGKLYCILGRNGSGKTTLLRILTGNLLPYSGSVLINGQDIQARSRQELAKLLAFVPQEHNAVFSYSVRDMVVMGRNPHLAFFARPTPADYQIADKALARVGLLSLKNRSYMDISGGERQMVFLARVIAQEASYFMLDEPTSHLDFSNQKSIMRMLQAIIREKGGSAVIALHDPSLTLEFADEVLMLKNGSLYAQGVVEEVMTSANLAYLYDMDIKIIHLDTGERLLAT